MKVKFDEKEMLVHSDIKIPAPTDKDKVYALFTELGIPFDIMGDSFVLTPKRGTPVTGYNCFYTQFEFQKDGKLASVVIAE